MAAVDDHAQVDGGALGATTGADKPASGPAQQFHGRGARWQAVGECRCFEVGGHLVPCPVRRPIQRDGVAPGLGERMHGLESGEDGDVVFGRRAAEADADTGHGRAPTQINRLAMDPMFSRDERDQG